MADLAASGGSLHLHLSQIAPASGSSAGGSGHVSLGTYLIQVVGSTGQLAGHGLGLSTTIALHYGPREVALDLAHAFVVMNGSFPNDVNLNPDPSGPSLDAASAGIGSPDSQPLTFDASQKTLSAPTSMSSPSTTANFLTNSPISTFGKPDPFNVDLNAGSLTSAYPLDVPAGPGGLKPPLTLAYASAGVAEQHDPQGAAPWVGEGWNLSLGAVSWSEHNVTNLSGGSAWQDTWQLSDQYGTASELIPPSTTTKTSNDDSSNPLTTAPLAWRTAPDNHARVISYPTPNFTDDPSAVSWGGSHVDLFARGSDGALWHRGFDTSGWHAWESLAGTIVGSPDAASWGSGHLDVFARSTDGKLWHRGYDWTLGGWQAWESLGAPGTNLTLTSDPGAVSWASNRVDLFAVASDGNLWHRYYAAGVWGGWDSLGTPSGVTWASAPDAASWGSGHLDVAALGSDGALWHRGYDGAWQTWDSRGAPGVGLATSSPGAVSWATNRFDLFARGNDNALWHQWFDTSGWHPWESLGGSIVSGPDASSWASGHIDVFGRGSDGSMQHRAYDAGVWNPWETLSTPTLPCFRAFLPNGMMEEFGCTVDSMQFYVQPNGTNAGQDYIANWLLDLITDRNGNQIHVTYQQDLQANQAVSRTYPRDAVMSTVEWDSPGCHSSQAACTGAAWAPLMRVQFIAGNSAVFGGTPCPPNGTLRCDDPIDLSGSGGLANPTVQSTFILNAAMVQVRSTGAGAWNTLHQYQLSYDQGQPTTVTDPATGKQESTAGRLNLTRLVEIGTDGLSAAPATTFAYQRAYEYYEDDRFQAAGGVANCGPTGTTLCWLWSQSYEGNSYYLQTATNGMGLQQTFTFSNGRNNTHGGPSNPLDPLGCNGVATYPCTGADDESWSHAVLSIETGVANGVTSTSNYSYLLTGYAARACSDCNQGFYWGAERDGDYADFYNSKFMGFAQAWAVRPDSSLEKHYYYTTQGWGVYDTSQFASGYCNPPLVSCVLDSWWQINNAGHGHEFKFDLFQNSLQTIPLRELTTSYNLSCPPADGKFTVAGSPPVGGLNWNGNLVSELDPTNPVAACSITTANTHTVLEGTANSGTAPELITAYTYDGYGRTTSETDSSNDGAAAWYAGSPSGSPTSILKTFSYVWNDTMASPPTGSTATYLVDFPSFSDVEDGNHNQQACTYTHYDAMTADTNGQSGLLLHANVNEVGRYDSCGATRGTKSATQYTYVPIGNGNLLTTTDPDAHRGTACQASQCLAYDTTFSALVQSQTNAKDRTTSTNYDSTSASYGYGLWPKSTTDLNSQVTAYLYDQLGRPSSITLPDETSGQHTVDIAYDYSSCGATNLCLTVNKTQRLSPSVTVTSQSFYDGWDHLVETRTPGPTGSGNDVIRYSTYDVSGRLASQSVSYFVASGSGYVAPVTGDKTTQYHYDSLGRVTSTTDPLGNVTIASYGSICNVTFPGTADTGCYEETVTVDASHHEKISFADAMGRTDYEQTFTGSGPYSLYATVKYAYDFLGDLKAILHPDNVHTTISTYDALGRLKTLTDPDSGLSQDFYDPVGNLTNSIDARGASGTVWVGYDPLNRPLWHNSSNSPTGAYETFAYDEPSHGSGIGQLTSETFSEPGTSLSGAYSYVYDGRGQVTSAALTVGTTRYQPTQMSYDDEGNVKTQTYPTNEVVTNSYAGDWLTGATTSQGNTTLLSNATYAFDPNNKQFGGPARLITGAGSILYQYSATYDALLRPTDLKTTNGGGSPTLFEQSRVFDPVGNVKSANTALPAGTDNQAFCYDEQNRLTWAGSSGTPPCQTLTPGTLGGSAQYVANYSYDTLGRLTSGPGQGQTHIYGDAAHLHAATSVAGVGVASYDAAGNASCRAASGCPSAPATGGLLTYDREGRLGSWQNAASNPTNTDAFLYDNQGSRVAQQVVQSGTTTTTVYIGSLEEVSTTGATTTTTTYYYASGQRIAEAVNGVFSYLASDGLGSAQVALNSSGVATASVLYGPYGSVRYSSGTMPTSLGFTGQRADSVTGLDYYNARYYDPVAGQFTSADMVMPGSGYDPRGLSRYAYVQGNPETQVDPTGNCSFSVSRGSGAPQICPDSSSSAPTPSSPPPGVSQVTQCILSLACRSPVYATMTVDERIAFVSGLAGKYPGYNFAGWFDAIIGVLKFARDNHELPDSRFFSTVDAWILDSYSQGLALSLGLIAKSDNPAAAKWSAFFQFRAATPLGDTTRDGPAKRLWGAAEQAATDYGVDRAKNQRIGPTFAEVIYLGLGNEYRGAVALALPGFDPRWEWEASGLSSAVWVVAQADQQMVLP